MIKEILTITIPKPERFKISGDVGRLNVKKVDVPIYENQTPDNPQTKSRLIRAWITGEGITNIGQGFTVIGTDAFISDVNKL